MTVEEIIALVTEALEVAVAERGADFVYPEEWMPSGLCKYQLGDGSAACIVGLAARKIDPEIAMPFDGAPTSNVIGRALGMVDSDCDNGYGEPEGFPFKLRRALDVAQSAQDMGETWGEALKAYYMELGIHKP